MTTNNDYDSTQHLIEIAAELLVSREQVTNVRDMGGFLSFTVCGRDFTNKLTKTGRHKKNSVRLSNV